MNDVMKGLAQLKKARVGEDPPEPPKPAPVAAEPPVSRGEDKTLAGRVPLTLHRQFSRLLLDTADELGLKRVYADEALEAAVRLILEDDDARARWQALVAEVRQGRRG